MSSRTVADKGLLSGSLQEQDSWYFQRGRGNKAGIAALFDRAEGDE